jgi:hypothetical protein
MSAADFTRAAADFTRAAADFARAAVARWEAPYQPQLNFYRSS